MRQLISGFMIVLLGFSVLGAGCAPKVGGSDYDATGVRSAQTVTFGTVQSVRVVRIQGASDTRTGLSTAGGALAGGVLGSLIGGGSGRTVATVGGALLGAGAGFAGSQALSAQDGFEITVELENGSLIAVTQGTDLQFSRGQRVRVISGGGTTRVVHAS